MSNRKGNRAQRRLAAKKMANGEVDILATIPAPPNPELAWTFWWDARSRSWMEHDPRVISWVRCLARCPDPKVIGDIAAAIAAAPDLVETSQPD